MNKPNKKNTTDFKAYAIQRLQEDYRFSLSDLISEGAFSWVFKATNLKLGRVVALKILKKQYSEAKNLLDEAKIQASFKHSGIASIYKVEHIDDILFFEMEYIHGTSLFDYIFQKKRLSEQETSTIGIKLLNIIQEIHSNNIIHGDINTNNILIDKNGEPHLIDFGVSLLSNNNGENMVKHLGAREFISPEMLSGSTINFKSDYYSLGVVLYECLTGKVPFVFKNQSLYDVILHQSPIPFSKYDINVNSKMAKTIFALMAKPPNQRPASIKQIRNGLSGNPKTVGSYFSLPSRSLSGKRKNILIYSIILTGILIIGLFIHLEEKKTIHSAKNQKIQREIEMQGNPLAPEAPSMSNYVKLNEKQLPGEPGQYILKHEITIEQFRDFVFDTGYLTDAEKNNASLIYNSQFGLQRSTGVNWRHNEDGSLINKKDYPKRPVVHVSWNDAVAYCKWAGETLPSFKTWEKLAFPEDTTLSISKINDTVWYSENALDKIQNVQLKASNQNGLYDILGNVGEWCVYQGNQANEKMPVCGGNISSTLSELTASLPVKEQKPSYSDGLTGFRTIKIID